MQYINHYLSPLGDMLMAADEEGLTGLWFVGQKYFARQLDENHREKDLPLFQKTKKWLDIYFSRQEPDFNLPLHLLGTAFQREVWQILADIPYGKTMTYGDIAKILAVRRGKEHFSAQAVGGAVGKNQLSIVIPCHRVLGTNGNLTGYAGGIDRKVALLTLEKTDQTSFFVPQTSS